MNYVKPPATKIFDGTSVGFGRVDDEDKVALTMWANGSHSVGTYPASEARAIATALLIFADSLDQKQALIDKDQT